MAITDDFNRASLGANWEASEGTVWATNGSVTVRPVSTYATTSIRRTESSFPNDQYAQAECRHTSATDVSVGGVKCRADATNTYYFAYIQVNTCTLKKRVAGVDTFLDDFAGTVNADTYYTLKIEAIGTVVKVYIDGVEVCSFDDSSDPITSGKPGLYASMGNQALDFDDFESTDASAAGPSSFSKPMWPMSYF